MITKELQQQLKDEAEKAFAILETRPINYQMAQLYLAVADLENTFDALFRYGYGNLTDESIQQLITIFSQSEDQNVFLALAEENLHRSTPLNLTDCIECLHFIKDMIARCDLQYKNLRFVPLS